MQQAWTMARRGAKRFGATPRLYFACALRLAWRDLKLALARNPQTKELIPCSLSSPVQSLPLLPLLGSLSSPKALAYNLGGFAMGYLYLAAMLVCGAVMDMSLVPHMTIDDAALFIVGLIGVSAFALLTIGHASKG